jgi:hypothetical protein
MINQVQTWGTGSRSKNSFIFSDESEEFEVIGLEVGEVCYLNNLALILSANMYVVGTNCYDVVTGVWIRKGLATPTSIHRS